MIKHYVDNNTGDRNVKPQRQGPASYPAVPDEIQSYCAIECNQNERHYHNRQDDMTDQDRKIERPHHPLPWKRRVSMVVMIGKIRNQK